MVSKKQQNLKINYNFCLTIIMIKQTKRLFFTLRNILFKNKERFYITTPDGVFMLIYF